MKKEENIIVGISVGDLNGIGPEIIIKAYEDNRSLELNTPVIFASGKTMQFFKNHFNSKINFFNIDSPEKIVHGKVNVVNVWKEPVKIEFGKPNKKIGEYAIKSLEAATNALKNNFIDVLVTAPINKHNIQSDTFNFPGHTDYLAKALNGKSLMFMVSNELRVGLLTDHVPLKEASNTITEDLITEKISTVIKSLKQDFGIRKPKVAVLAINPHAGDNGVIGDEDDKVLKPTLEKIKSKGDLVFGPYSADSFFGSNTYKNFDAIIASYHDQGLIPFKTIAFGQGVNYTAGLEKVRTSPDHGTAYEIAGKGIADENSMKQAIDTAIQIFRNRNDYNFYSKNPLKKASR
ncbi:4-hydroxythreonine-4-phosphate dehydrogenase PdxA [Winogradskyella echinorum]|uniref:4-hydroxythreonine-4-phosphate dehydrogenase PdxA n=1 Tax=Winogradskyella echinorum TaxID=538189 RepID=A0ABR6XZ92_9FLAO|nr:4-hydroxythreonine-4-phosphate dehydrogenase PdxA [Winogradskyella echinorum]MBC3845807.1 4-hydroxythreonine-4-phosphate dehydrogenase PdxA [Winogradskyella echinorum]MBC5750155.1 4-hydroxythreonine-4-phosphate dehydrogenase PdxA [Winogradskyella echinorum]